MDPQKKDNIIAEVHPITLESMERDDLPPQKVSFGKKILYHLWDSDQHLKSPE